jgi:peptide/nickel transport system permease protein
MKFLIRRILLTIPILLLVSILTFSLIHMIPGDPARVILGEDITPEAYEALRHELGLNDPIVIQYFNWIGKVLQGDLGISITDRVPVSQLILERLPATIEFKTFKGRNAPHAKGYPNGVSGSLRISESPENCQADFA